MAALRAQRPMPSRARGFTLVEVLVALVIVSLALGLLVRIFSSGLSNTQVAADYATATAFAESTLAAIGVATPLAAGQSEGAIDNRFRRVVAVRPYTEGEEQDDEDFRDLEAYQVTVTVLWQDGSQQRSVALTSLRVVESE